MSSEKKVCIVGYGSIAKRHHFILKELLSKKSTFTICDLNFGENIDDICNRNFDILIICTNTVSHLDVAEKFTSINDFCFIEKPISCDLKSAINFKNKQLSKKIHVACNLRFTDAYRRIEEISDDVIFANIFSMSYLPHWHPGKDHLKGYSANKSQGGGALLDLIHEPDYAFSIFGKPERSHKIEKRLMSGITNDSFDTCSLTWEYSDKIINFSISYGSKEYLRFFDAILKSGDRSKITFDLPDITCSYKRQWEFLLKHGPINKYNDCMQLMKVLDL
jgi:predicted dehydrogenase